MAAEFKISRLRFNYLGQWEAASFYNRDAIVTYQGQAYVCLEPHTSNADFYYDYRFVTQEGASTPRWDLMIPGREWKGVWEADTAYSLGNIVIYGGGLYECISEHISGSLTIDPSKWVAYTKTDRWTNNWAANTVYGLGDIVKYGGIVYRCISNHVSAIDTTAGLEADQASWEIVNNGIEYKGDWAPLTRYKANDIARNSSNLYIALEGHTSGTTIDATKWELWQPGTSYVNSWSSASMYQPGDVVVYGGYSYVSLTVNNVNNIPSVNGSIYWELVTQGYSMRNAWQSGVAYREGDIVNHGGNLYIALDDSIGLDPTVSENSGSWAIVVPGTYWKSYWEQNRNYYIGDIVLWDNATYKCIQSITSLTSSVRPDQDTAHVNWAIHSVHNRFNAGKTDGDIVTRSTSGTNTSVAIGEQDQVLQVNNTQPSWDKILSVPYVYYVAPEGVDADGYGDTWDKPWKTIKYACEKVSAGMIYPGASGVLTVNKEFLVEEMYQWMVYQVQEENNPFTSASIFDEFSTRRDAGLLIDAIIHDVTRNSNSRVVYATRAYFASGSKTEFINNATDAAQPYIVASLNYLKNLVSSVLSNNVPAQNYQEINGVLEENRVIQNTTSGFFKETGTEIIIEDLLDIAITAIESADSSLIPLPNQGLTATIMLKTGTYAEELPIVVPDNTAIVGDELRGAVVQPKTAIYTIAKSSNSLTNELTLAHVNDLEVNMPIQFSVSSVNDYFSGITLSQTYYVKSISGRKVTVSETIGGDAVALINGTGNMTTYAGDCLKDMFYMRNATGLRNMTLTGLAGSLGPVNSFGTRRPTGGAYTSLDPGTGPEDTSVWIMSRSPYIQNVTNFGVGCVGMKIDGTLHNGGNKSMVANDYTQIVSDGIGIWCTGSDSLTECVSVFCYYNYAGYFAEDGGRIRATNGNSSYGTYGVVAEGFDNTESPISGKIDNQSTQVQASVQSAFGASAQLLSMQYLNAGSSYYEETTNLLKHSNHLDETLFWNTDGNISLQMNTASPFGNPDAWTITALTSSSVSSYLYQDIAIAPAGYEYSNLMSLNITGSGVDATFDITVGNDSYSALVNVGGSGYVVGNQLRILGSELGGIDGTNDCFLTVKTLSGSAILSVDVSGVVPEGSNKKYTLSIYAKKGTVQSFDLEATFSGNTPVTDTLSFNFDSKEFTAVSSAAGTFDYDKLELPDGWYRIWMTVSDYYALNDNLRFRVYPRGKTGFAGYTRFYGAQLQSAVSPTFYLETQNNRYNSYANYNISGAGTGAEVIGDELRTGSTYEVRITDTGLGVGGRGYLISSNNAQGGDDRLVVLAGSDINTPTNYIGMRIFLQSGTGAGQYGYISDYNDVNKYAKVLKESFDPITIETTDNATGKLFWKSGSNVEQMYVGLPIQFIPTYYTTSITNTSVDIVNIEETFGGTVNKLRVTSTAKLSVNMPVKFTGNTFGSLTTNFVYYIKEIFDETTFSVTTELFGSTWLLTSDVSGPTKTMIMTFPSYTSYIDGNTNNMKINMPISFTGTSLGGISVGRIYYVNDVINASRFTISSTLISLPITGTAGTTNYITTSGNTSSLVPMNPIEFSGTTFGGIQAGTKYYINKVVNSNTFTIVSELISTTATATETLSNLITVSSTTGFIPNNPIIFRGNTFGNLVNETVYYILAINNDTSFTVSLSPGGTAVNLITGLGQVEVYTTPSSITLTTAAGAMTATSTNSKESLSFGVGAMNATYSTNLFGNVVSGQTYYVKTITADSFTISENLGGGTFTLKTDAGSMNVGEVGWDHINPGTPIEDTLDNSTVYYVEPKLTFSDPAFSQVSSTLPTLSAGVSWDSVAYGNGTFIALPNGSQIAARSTDGVTWETIVLPEIATWSGIAYGNGTWVTISKAVTGTSISLYSNSNGDGWRVSSMPSTDQWSNIVYGNGVFVALVSGTNKTAYSTNFGYSWSSGSGLTSETWTGLTYGAGKFVAVASGSNAIAYSTNGINWNISTLPVTSDWQAVQFGNGMFTAVSGSGDKTVYSTDAINWNESITSIEAVDKLSYGQGVFVAISSVSSVAYTSENGITWKSRTISSSDYGSIAYGYVGTNKDGKFITVGGQSAGSVISAGCKTKGRTVIASNRITSITLWEPGSGYTSAPLATIFDPNITVSASLVSRLGNGSLGNPTFISRGEGYNTNSTVININGGGFADTFQTGLRLIVTDLTSLPGPGDNLTIEGNDTIYKVTNAEAVFGTEAPNIKANLQVSPDMTVAKSPLHNAAITIRTKYSQARLTGHDFLNVGYGNLIQSNYPNVPSETVLAPQDQAVEVNYGRVFYTSTDQDGNFKVGNLFGVEQATGIVTLSASQFGLQGLETLSLGGIAVGNASVVIRQFSTDQTMIANSNEVIPTQRAVKAYLTSRLSQGGANTFTGQLIAGTVLVGGPDKIASTIPDGIAGSSVQMPNLVKIDGEYTGWDGDGAAMAFFMRSWRVR